MKNKILYTFLTIFTIVSLTGCNNEPDYVKNQETKGLCVATECIKQIEITDTVEEINKIVGFDGELIDEEYNTYSWKLSDNSELEVTYYSSDESYIKIYIEEDNFKNDKVNLDKYDDIEKDLNDGIELKYEDFINRIGAEGILVEKTPYSKEYLWVNKDGGYLNATFQNSSGNCSFVSGWF